METLGILRFVFGSWSQAQLKCGWLLSEVELSLLPREMQASEWFAAGLRREEGLCVLEKKELTWRESGMREQDNKKKVGLRDRKQQNKGEIVIKGGRKGHG